MFQKLHIYTVHRKPGENAPEQVKFVREGFSIFAFVFTLLWALYHRLWLAAFALFAANGILMLLEEEGLLSTPSLLLLQLGMQLLAGLLGNDWVRAKLKRQGYITADIVTGDSRIRAEQRFFERLLATPAAA